MRRTQGKLQSYLPFLGSLLVLGALSGCHSPYVEATIDNQSSSPLKLIEVDYPSASFGVGNLAARSQFHYRFKVQGSGTLKVEFTGADGKIHEVDGPEIHQGQEGSLTIVIDTAENVSWLPKLTPAK
jgi:hypothetical protein